MAVLRNMKGRWRDIRTVVGYRISMEPLQTWCSIEWPFFLSIKRNFPLKTVSSTANNV